MPAVIVENDESEWKDETGEIYHFPKRYLPILPPGQKVIYYKSRLRNPAYATERFSAEPHYFGIAEMAYNSIHWSGTTSTSGDPSDPNSWLKNAALHPNMAPDLDCNMGIFNPEARIITMLCRPGFMNVLVAAIHGMFHRELPTQLQM